MLVLSRLRDEKVIIQVGDRVISIVVTEISSYRVRLGFTAPEDVKIFREELLERKGQS